MNSGKVDACFVQVLKTVCLKFVPNKTLANVLFWAKADVRQIVFFQYNASMKTANCPNCLSQPKFSFLRRNSLGLDGAACKNCGQILHCNLFEVLLLFPVIAIPQFIYHDEPAKHFLGSIILFLIVFTLCAAFLPFRIKTKI